MGMEIMKLAKLQILYFEFWMPKSANPKPQTPNLKAQTPNPKPQISKLTHQTPNPKWQID
jgi:hypothetical protein